MSLMLDLARRHDERRPVRIGLIGAGEMGTDIVTQVSLMPGLVIAVLAELRTEAAWKALEIAGSGREAGRACRTGGEAADAVCAGLVAVTDDATLACSAEVVDVIIDATGNPGYGAELALLAMRNGKHVVMMNVEADVTVGAMLAREARRAGVCYSLGAGDEPTAIMELIGFVRSLGYPIVAAGKGKNNPLRFDARPSEYEEEARRRHMNPRMLVEFVDGSKTMIEMCAVANATGLVPDRPGMHGPAATREMLARTLVPASHGGILSRAGVVDYSVGQGVAPGVFVIVEAPHPRVDERLRDLKMGDGPFYAFLRPYHLTSLEVPLTAASVVLNGVPHMQPLPDPVAECGCVAKEALAAGTTLGRIGEDHYRGWISTVEEARRDELLPMGLAERAVVTRAIAQGEALTWRNCRPDETMEIVRLRRAQDAMLAERSVARAVA